MKSNPNCSARWFTVVIFAAAMAWVESAVVYYLRTMIHRIEPYQSDPLPMIGFLGPVELVREGATLVMLFTVGMLAGPTWRSRLGYSAIAFGVWDIFYYLFLKLICDWPHSPLDWDILFLLPLPWWGPVLAPVLIAVLMILWGTLVSQFEFQAAPFSTASKVWALNCLGAGLALYVFMADSLSVASQGANVIRTLLPVHFNWLLFSLALALMATPVLHLLWQIFSLQISKPAISEA